MSSTIVPTVNGRRCSLLRRLPLNATAPAEDTQSTSVMVVQLVSTSTQTTTLEPLSTSTVIEAGPAPTTTTPMNPEEPMEAGTLLSRSSPASIVATAPTGTVSLSTTTSLLDSLSTSISALNPVFIQPTSSHIVAQAQPPSSAFSSSSFSTHIVPGTTTTSGPTPRPLLETRITLLTLSSARAVSSQIPSPSSSMTVSSSFSSSPPSSSTVDGVTGLPTQTVSPSEDGSTSPPSPHNGRHISAGLAAGITLSVLALAGLVLIFWWMRRRKRRRISNDSLATTLVPNGGGPDFYDGAVFHSQSPFRAVTKDISTKIKEVRAVCTARVPRLKSARESLQSEKLARSPRTNRISSTRFSMSRSRASLTLLPRKRASPLPGLAVIQSSPQSSDQNPFRDPLPPTRPRRPSTTLQNPFGDPEAEPYPSRPAWTPYGLSMAGRNGTAHVPPSRRPSMRDGNRGAGSRSAAPKDRDLVRSDPFDLELDTGFRAW